MLLRVLSCGDCVFVLCGLQRGVSTYKMRSGSTNVKPDLSRRYTIGVSLAFEVGISVDILEVEFELIDPPHVAVLDQIKVIAADKRPRVLSGVVGQIVGSRSVAKRARFVALDIDEVVADLVMNRLEVTQTLFPRTNDVVRRERDRLTADHRRHVELHLGGEAFLDTGPVQVVSVNEQPVDGVDDFVFLDDCTDFWIHWITSLLPAANSDFSSALCEDITP